MDEARQYTKVQFGLSLGAWRLALGPLEVHTRRVTFIGRGGRKASHTRGGGHGVWTLDVGAHVGRGLEPSERLGPETGQVGKTGVGREGRAASGSRVAPCGSRHSTRDAGASGQRPAVPGGAQRGGSATLRPLGLPGAVIGARHQPSAGSRLKLSSPNPARASGHTPPAPAARHAPARAAGSRSPPRSR